MYRLENGLIGYGCGLGKEDGVADGHDDRCLILAVEIREDGTQWAHILRLRDKLIVPAKTVVHLRV